MVLKARYRWGYRTLIAEVSDSIHLRRFCRISLSERVPDESTVRKLTRRIGAETVSEVTRALIVKATREKRFRPRAVRIDSTVIEADVKYPTDAGLASSGVRVLATEGRKLAKLIAEKQARVRGSLPGDGSQAPDDHPHDPSALRRGQAGGAEADRRDRRAVGALDPRGTAARRDRKARGRCAKARLKAAVALEEMADRCEKVGGQIKQRVAGKPIKNRIVSLHDPDARPIRKGSWASRS
jgi:IS5 family transposase